ncbi:MAG: hypothetical protein U1E31_01370 [Rickettsiales bacterium]
MIDLYKKNDIEVINNIKEFGCTIQIVKYKNEIFQIKYKNKADIDISIKHSNNYYSFEELLNAMQLLKKDINNNNIKIQKTNSIIDFLAELKEIILLQIEKNEINEKNSQNYFESDINRYLDDDTENAIKEHIKQEYIFTKSYNKNGSFIIELMPKNPFDDEKEFDLFEDEKDFNPNCKLIIENTNISSIKYKKYSNNKFNDTNCLLNNKNQKEESTRLDQQNETNNTFKSSDSKNFKPINPFSNSFKNNDPEDVDGNYIVSGIPSYCGLNFSNPFESSDSE